jgi:hypothetical protein
MLKLLEHFAGPDEPDNITAGQIWYDTANHELKMRTAVGGWAIIETLLWLFSFIHLSFG